MSKVKIVKGQGPYGSAPHVRADLDDACAARVADSAQGCDDQIARLIYQVDALTKIVGVLAKCVNEAGLMGTGDVGEIIGAHYSVEY